LCVTQTIKELRVQLSATKTELERALTTREEVAATLKIQHMAEVAAMGQDIARLEKRATVTLDNVPEHAAKLLKDENLRLDEKVGWGGGRVVEGRARGGGGAISGAQPA
jgi:hypothetical protein